MTKFIYSYVSTMSIHYKEENKMEEQITLNGSDKIQIPKVWHTLLM